MQYARDRRKKLARLSLAGPDRAQRRARRAERRTVVDAVNRNAAALRPNVRANFVIKRICLSKTSVPHWHRPGRRSGAHKRRGNLRRPAVLASAAESERRALVCGERRTARAELVENVEAALAHAVVRDARPAPAPALARWGGREPRSAKGASSQGCPSALEMLRFSIGEDAGERGGGHDFSRR